MTAGTHGADQTFVQRYLCSRSPAKASRALVWSGCGVFAQFALFLVIDIMLWAYYTTYAPGKLASGHGQWVVQTDRVFPTFMMTHLPLGLRGLMVATIFAAATSTLLSSLNSSAASIIGDFYLPSTGGRPSDRHYLGVSRRVTVLWATVPIAVTFTAIGISRRVVDEVLGIQSFTGDLLFGVFLLAFTATRRLTAPVTGIVAGATGLIAFRLSTAVSWQWYGLVGSATTFSVGYLVAPAGPYLGGGPAPEAS